MPALRFPGTVASGWSVMKIAGGLRGVRTVTWDTNGNMLVAEAGKGISVHSFGDNGCISSSATLISNVQLNHGLAISPDGKTIYASGERSVWSWTYDPATKAVTNQKTVITGMDSGIHSTRNVLVVKSQPNFILVQVGSNANLDMQAAQPATGRAIIKIFDVTKAGANGLNYKTDGEVFAYGLRNEIGFVQDPAGIVWGVENSGDVCVPLFLQSHIDDFRCVCRLIKFRYRISDLTTRTSTKTTQQRSSITVSRLSLFSLPLF